jgi:hypothetical protein
MQQRQSSPSKSRAGLKAAVCLLLAAGSLPLAWANAEHTAQTKELRPPRAGGGGTAGAAGEVVWLETEYFTDAGGWTKDWQFVDQMGSPYLMAIGYGAPVADAKTTLKAIKPGRYRLWARTKDWLPQFHPGKFEISLAGKKAAHVFGASGREGWVWEDGGVHELQGDVTVALHDRGGYYGRCDVIVLSPDTAWVPPSGKPELGALRIRHGALSAEIEDRGTYDVVVVGGGIAGTFAAISAARQGAKTVLIQNRTMLGGNASTENLVPPVGAMQNRLSKEEIDLDPRETGLIEEINLYGKQRYFEVGKYWPSRLKLLAEAEPNLKLFFNTEATAVEMRNSREIASVTCTDIDSGRRMRFHGTLFIDCTGNGMIGIRAGAKYMFGKESKAMYNETKAPAVANTETLGSSLKYWYTKQDAESSFRTPEWAYQFKHCSDFGDIKDRHPSATIIDTQWVIELGGVDKTYEKAEEVRDDLLRLIYGLWDHIKNNCADPVNAGAAKMKLAWVGHVVGMRENYRLLGDYVMTEADVIKQPLLEDRVAYGGWGLDDHPSLGFFDKSRLKNHTHGGLLFSIPYRSLYSANISNLMMAGRNISVTHVALTGTRVMLTTGTIGQAVGTAAGMCINKGIQPRGVYQSHLTELQQRLLKDGAYLIELANSDPRDLALRATVTASSGGTLATEAINGFSRVRLPTTFPQASLKLNAWTPAAGATGDQWLQLAWDQPTQFNVVHVVFQNRGKLAHRKFTLEYHDGQNWRKAADVENPNAHRRLVIPVGSITSQAFRVTLKENIHYHGGICEVRIYHEDAGTVEMIKRVNRTVDTPLENVALPWER